MPIEVEIRSFISKEQFDELFNRLSSEGELIITEEDETEYYASNGAVRLWKNEDKAKIILKTGDIHDEHREENEITIKKTEFPLLQEMFRRLEISKHIKWKRKRHTFKWAGITVQLGDNVGYGYVIELEKLTSEHEKEKALEELKEKFNKLQVKLTPKEEFKNKYEWYKNNWPKILDNN